MPGRPILLISAPRSGSDWFAERCLGWRGPDYFREYFNPVTNPRHGLVLNRAFGSEVDWENIAVPFEAQDDICERIFRETWATDSFRSTKETWSAFKIGFFAGHFECFALIGHRAGTFPGRSLPRHTGYWWGRYFQSLEFNRHLLDEPVEALVDRAREGPADPRRRSVAAQIIATYQTVSECRRLGIPIVEYRELIALPTAGAIRDYLAVRLPGPLDAGGVADRVFGSRRVVDKSCDYDAWGVEGFARDLIERMPAEVRPYF